MNQYLKLTIILVLITCSFISAAQDEPEIAPVTYKKNHECPKCHGQKYFSYFNEYAGRDIKERMNPL